MMTQRKQVQRGGHVCLCRAHGPGVSTPARARLVPVPGRSSGGGSERGGPGERARAAAAGAACAPRRGWRWPEQRECDEAALPRCSARRQLTALARSTPGGEPRGRDLGRGGKRRGREGKRRRHPESLGPPARTQPSPYSGGSHVPPEPRARPGWGAAHAAVHGAETAARCGRCLGAGQGCLPFAASETERGPSWMSWDSARSDCSRLVQFACSPR
ncbi:hypothetical protein NN561_001239 [Cricetulus griseus]